VIDREMRGTAHADADGPALREACLRQVQERLGFRPTESQARQLETAAARVLAGSGPTDPAALYRAIVLDRRADLLERLVGELTVGETHFYRVAPQVEALRQVVFPDLLARRAASQRLQVWSAGCSTGEEPYTIAILLRELRPEAEWRPDIVATDVDQGALEAARRASYGEWSFRETPGWVRERYFQPQGRRWQLDPSIRRMVRFEPLNLAEEARPAGAPEASFDLVLCRNVTIYLTPDVTSRLYARLTAALRPGGWLVLGPSDPVPAPSEPLEPVYLPGALLWRRLEVPVLPVERRRSAPTGPATAAPGGGLKRLVPIADVARAASVRANQPVRPDGTQQRLRPASTPAPARGEPVGNPDLLLGLRYLEGGEVGAALARLRRAAFLDDRHPFVHFSLARACLAHGERARARAALQHARRLLATAPDEEVLPDAGGLLAGELRQAVEGLLVGLESGDERS
jgi:chemotaxis protein methyltransferase CheR